MGLSYFTLCEKSLIYLAYISSIKIYSGFYPLLPFTEILSLEVKIFYFNVLEICYCQMVCHQIDLVPNT